MHGNSAGTTDDAGSVDDRRQEGRLARRRRGTRARLIEAAYKVMAERGVDAAKIQDITEHADVGFGTFYNYFQTKDELAGQVLDCVIEDLGRRNIIATRELRKKSPALVMPVSMRLVLQEATRTPIWQWWALRPDLLADRMREGFKPFAMRDMRDAIAKKLFDLSEDDLDPAWALANWVMVGGIHDVVAGGRPTSIDKFVVGSIMRLMGVPAKKARTISQSALPKYPPPDIDWTFDLSIPRQDAVKS